MSALPSNQPNEPTELQRALNGLQVEYKCALDNEATARSICGRLGRLPPTPISEGDRVGQTASASKVGLMDEINGILQSILACHQRTASLLEQINRTV